MKASTSRNANAERDKKPTVQRRKFTGRSVYEPWTFDFGHVFVLVVEDAVYVWTADGFRELRGARWPRHPRFDIYFEKARRA